MRLWLPWTTLVGAPNRLTVDEFRAAIGNFQRSRLLIACARLSTAFRFGPEALTAADKEITAKWIPELFPPELVPRVQAYAAQGWVIFFQGQLRYLAAETLRSDALVSEDNPQNIPDISLGPMLLSSAELLYKPHAVPSNKLDGMLSFIAAFLPFYEIDSVTDPVMLFLRFYIFLTVIIPRLPQHLRTFDVPMEFEAVFGFPLRLYCLFVFSCLIHARIDRNEKPVDAPLGGSFGKEWFRFTNVTDEQIEKLFATVSCTLDDLPDTKKTHGFADFEYLRDHPYFRYENQLYCLDYEYAVAKLESGVVWRLRSALPENRRFAYFSFWGQIFEEYIAWLFEQYADKKRNIFHRSPKYQDDSNLPICDAIVMCDRTAVLIEAKLATCAADVRYSGDYIKVKKYFNDKLVVGTTRKVGVGQLLTALDDISNKPKNAVPEFLHGVRKFIPLIITKDDITSSWMTNAYLNARFQGDLSKRTRKRFVVTPLVSMSIATLERAMAALTDNALSDILEDRITGAKQLAHPFEVASSYVPRGTARKMNSHIEIMHALTEQIIKEFGMVEDSFEQQ